MNLAASASQTSQTRQIQMSQNSGYAMAALLVGMAVMAIMLSVAMPTWNQMIRREKEEELVFRGNQYARAINFYQRKFANASPANFDILVEQHMLRKKYKDPMSPDKDGAFQPLYINNSGQAGPGSGGQRGSTGQPGSVGTALGTTPTGGIMGVTSKNKGESLRAFNGKTHYNEWQFIALQTSIQGGAGPGGRGQGGPGGGRGPAGQGFPGVGQPGSGPQRGGGPQRGSGPGGAFPPPRGQGSPQSPFQPFQPPSQPGSPPPSRGPR